MGRRTASAGPVRSTLRDSLPHWVHEFRDWQRLPLMPVEEVMEELIALAAENVRKRDSDGGGPHAAAIVRTVGQQCRILCAAPNMVRYLRDPTAHASVIAIRLAAEAQMLPLSRQNTDDDQGQLGLVVTTQPCGFCARAVALAHLNTVVFAAPGEVADRAGQDRLGDDGLDVLETHDIETTSLRDLKHEASQVIQDWARGCEVRGDEYNPKP